jgi:hypothetical protein
MPQRDPEQYTLGDDGLIVEKVGSWAIEKLKLVTDYVYASGGARKKYLGTGAAYIDPFCGSGRSLIRGTTTFIDGSPVAAFKRALQSPGRFTSIDISDDDEALLVAATTRLTALSAPVRPVPGPASEAIPKIIQSLDRYGLHLAFLDPYSLGALSFDLFEELANLKNIDVIAHVSVSDLQRNAARYADEDYVVFLNVLLKYFLFLFWITSSQVDNRSLIQLVQIEFVKFQLDPGAGDVSPIPKERHLSNSA